MKYRSDVKGEPLSKMKTLARELNISRQFVLSCLPSFLFIHNARDTKAWYGEIQFLAVAPCILIARVIVGSH